MNHSIESEVEKRYKEKDRAKRKRMAVHGKSVFLIQKLADNPKKRKK